MKLSSFALFVTDYCNFDCSYCNQKKEKKYLKKTTIKKAIDFFYPFFEEDKDISIVFYGGEPLLAFELIEYTVSLLQEKNKAGGKRIKYSLTTNGSLLTEKMLRFFNDHGFSIMLSFDGLAQDVNRKPGTFKQMKELVKHILTASFSGIEFSTNSVFTPASISYFSESLRNIIELGVPEIRYSLNLLEPWDQEALKTLKGELKRLADLLLTYYREKGTIPVSSFQGKRSSSKKGFLCVAGHDRMAVSPVGDVWGCYLFYDYLKDKQESEDYRSYYFGKLTDFIKNFDTVYPWIAANYRVLRQSSFFTDERFCFLCNKVKECVICPAYAAHSTSLIGKIHPRFCSIDGIQSKEKEEFLTAVKNTNL